MRAPSIYLQTARGRQVTDDTAVESSRSDGRLCHEAKTGLVSAGYYCSYLHS